MTPRLLELAVGAHSRQIKRQRDDATSTAWLTAALYRSKKLPKLEKLLKDANAAPVPAKSARDWKKQKAGWAKFLDRK